MTLICQCREQVWIWGPCSSSGFTWNLKGFRTIRLYYKLCSVVSAKCGEWGHDCGEGDVQQTCLGLLLWPESRVKHELIRGSRGQDLSHSDSRVLILQTHPLPDWGTFWNCLLLMTIYYVYLFYTKKGQTFNIQSCLWHHLGTGKRRKNLHSLTNLLPTLFIYFFFSYHSQLTSLAKFHSFNICRALWAMDRMPSPSNPSSHTCHIPALWPHSSVFSRMSQKWYWTTDCCCGLNSKCFPKTQELKAWFLMPQCSEASGRGCWLHRWVHGWRLLGNGARWGLSVKGVPSGPLLSLCFLITTTSSFALPRALCHILPHHGPRSNKAK